MEGVVSPFPGLAPASLPPKAPLELLADLLAHSGTKSIVPYRSLLFLFRENLSAGFGEFLCQAVRGR